MPGTPATTGLFRVWIIPYRAGPENEPDYKECTMADDAGRSFGGVNKVECPSSDRYDAFVTKTTYRDADELPTMSLTSRHLADAVSYMYELGRAGCPFDVQLHTGTCQSPDVFTDFDMAWVLEAAYVESWTGSGLGALASGDRSEVDESADLSGEHLYQIVRLSFSSEAGDIITNELLDGVICGTPLCGDCDEEGDGCFYAFFITSAAGGSPGTPADIIYTPNKGANWYADDIDTLGAAEDPSGVDCIGKYVVVVSNASGSLHYALKSEVVRVGYDEDWTEVTTGFVTNCEPRAIDSVGAYAFIVGDAGYIYECDNPLNGVTVLDAGVATAAGLNEVDALDRYHAVAVGDAGAIVYTVNGTSWTAAPSSPVGAGVSLNTVAMRSEDEWWVGTSGGQLFYTLDAGVSWTEKTFTGSGAGEVRRIEFPTASVGYFTHDTATPAGRMWRTYNGGRDWSLMPEDSAVFPANDRMTALATCEYDVNYVVAGGLADNGTDGFLVVGQD